MSSAFVAFRPGARTVSIAVLTAWGLGLAGCAGVGDSALSGAFVDPSKYELFDCKQLETERQTLEERSAELQGRIDKARTGAAGTVVGEAVYRNDYVATRASLKLANEAWERSRCVATPAPPLRDEPGLSRAGR